MHKIWQYYELGYAFDSRVSTLFYFPTQKYFTILFKFLDFLRSLDRFKLLISEFYMDGEKISLKFSLIGGEVCPPMSTLVNPQLIAPQGCNESFILSTIRLRHCPNRADSIRSAVKQLGHTTRKWNSIKKHEVKPVKIIFIW